MIVKLFRIKEIAKKMIKKDFTFYVKKFQFLSDIYLVIFVL